MSNVSKKTVSNVLIWRYNVKEARSFFTKDEAYDLEVSEDEIVLYVFTPCGMKIARMGDCIVKFGDETFNIVRFDELAELLISALDQKKDRTKKREQQRTKLLEQFYSKFGFHFVFEEDYDGNDMSHYEFEDEDLFIGKAVADEDLNNIIRKLEVTKRWKNKHL